jgi:hypothetical protein
MRTILSLFALLVVMNPLALRATEKGGPEIQNQRQTSTIDEISIKPLFLYSSRGRRDPFTFDMSLNNNSAKASRDFSISSLSLVGFFGEWPNQTALFVSVWRQTTYKFRGGRLFSPEGVPVADVTGFYKSKGSISLTQGESSILFRMENNPRTTSLRSTIDENRKEPQR